MAEAPVRREWLDSANPAGTKLRLEFVWTGDRFYHSLSAIDESGHVFPLLRSVEGSDADSRLPSPPLQSLAIEDRGDGKRIALLVGMAGGNHWSASIEPLHSQVGFIFDIACRPANDWRELKSTYQLTGPDAAWIVAPDNRSANARLYNPGIRLCVEADRKFDCGIPVTEKGLVITALPSSGLLRTTERWRYQIWVAGDDQPRLVG